MDIYSRGEYPADVLSNFYANAFELDGVPCASMEGFLQSLKTKDPAEQRRVCALSGVEAKKYFHRSLIGVRWKLTGTLHWNGEKYHRSGDEYQCLLDRAYDALFRCNANFRQALRDSRGEPLCHTIGKRDTRKTVLTEYEFVSRLERLRTLLCEEKK